MDINSAVKMLKVKTDCSKVLTSERLLHSQSSNAYMACLLNDEQGSL